MNIRSDLVAFSKGQFLVFRLLLHPAPDWKSGLTVRSQLKLTEEMDNGS
jgi:hypothetical protein